VNHFLMAVHVLEPKLNLGHGSKSSFSALARGIC
jgi:hypothetical protein